MKVAAAIKKVENYFKKHGHPEVKMEIVGHRYTFVYNGQVGSFFPNGARTGSPEALEADATNYHVRSVNDHSDSMTDYFAGSFRDNITQVCESMLPPPSKFRAGELVRGKQNKRAIRQGFAGHVGLVMQTVGGKYVRVAWVGAEEPRFGWPTYPERDLEIV
jgi:hypothetical protein